MEPLKLTIDCSGSVRGGIRRVLEELEAHWNPEDELTLIAAPAGFVPTQAKLHSYQSGGRAKTLLAASRAVSTQTKSGICDGLLSISPTLTAASSRAPIVTILHDLAHLIWPRELSKANRRYREVGYQANLRRSKAIRCVSNRTLHDLAGQMSWARDRAEVWQLPTPTLLASPTRSALVAELATAGIGRPVAVPGHSEHKGVELAIAGLVDLPPDVGLIVATRGELVSQFEELARTFGVTPRIRYAVDLSDEEYAALLRDSEVTAMPSHFEGLGLPILEARRFGARTVVSPDPALWEASAGSATRMTTWTSNAFAEAVTMSLTKERPEPFIDARTWTSAANDLRDDFIALRAG